MVARLQRDRRQRHACAARAQPGAARAARRGRHPRLAGRRPVRRPGPLGRADARRARARAAPRPARRPPEPRAPEHAHVEPHQRDRRQRRPPRPARPRRARGRARAPARSAAARSPSTCGEPTCPPVAGRDLPLASTPSAAPTTKAGTRPLTARRRPSWHTHRRLAGALHALFPDKVLVVTEFGAEATRRNAAGAPRRPRLPGDLLARHIRAYQRRPACSAACSPGACRTSPCDRTSSAAPFALTSPHRPAAGDQREGAVHLRRPPEARERGRPAPLRAVTRLRRGRATTTGTSGPTAGARDPQRRRHGGRAPRCAAPPSSTPWAPRRAGESTSRANGSRSPRSQAAAGIEKPRLRPRAISRGSERRDRAAQQPLLLEAAHLQARRQGEGELGDVLCRGTAPSPRGSAPCSPGPSSRAGRPRGRCRRSTSCSRASGSAPAVWRSARDRTSSGIDAGWRPEQLAPRGPARRSPSRRGGARAAAGARRARSACAL